MKRLFGFLAVLMVMSLVLGACGTPAATTEAPTAEVPTVEAPTAETPAAEATTTGEKTVLNVWSFTNEILTMAVAFEKTPPGCGCSLHDDPHDKR